MRCLIGAAIALVGALLLVGCKGLGGGEYDVNP